MCLDGTRLGEAAAIPEHPAHDYHAHQHDRGEHDVRRVGRRAMIAGGAAAALAASLPTPVRAAGRVGQRRIRDLTHAFTESFPVYTFDKPDRETIATIATNGFYAQRWTFSEHSGTHIDVPGHFAPGGRLLPQITAAELILPAVVVDISTKAARDPDAELTLDDLHRFERRHGRIPAGAAVLMHSGWELRLSTGEYKGQDAESTFHFPGFAAEAVEWLLDQRGITCVGVDTLSLDHGASTTFDVHRLLLGADRYGLENVARLASIPPRGATLYVGAVPLEDGSGGPCRLIATW